jgi:hypothetical protein
MSAARGAVRVLRVAVGLVALGAWWLCGACAGVWY